MNIFRNSEYSVERPLALLRPCRPQFHLSDGLQFISHALSRQPAVPIVKREVKSSIRELRGLMSQIIGVVAAEINDDVMNVLPCGE